MRELHVAEHDLYQAVMRSSVQEAIGPDGVHPTEAGRELLAAAVSDLLWGNWGGANGGKGLTYPPAPCLDESCCPDKVAFWPPP